MSQSDATWIDREPLLQYLEGALDADAVRTLEGRLAAQPRLRDELEKLRALRAVLREIPRDRFAPDFAGRVARRLAAFTEFSGDSVLQSFRWAFARMALPGAALAIVLSLSNVIDAQSLGLASSWIEDLFVLPSDTLIDSLSYTALSNIGD